jgi:DNA-binding GntR family transcriptional regulator
VSAKGIDRDSATLTYRVTEMLRKEIVRGEREADSRLSEVAIAAAYDVSRGPVREAIQRLASDGLVVVEPHRGAFVKRLDRRDVVELFEIRIALECEAAALAAEKLTDDGLEQLRQMQQQSASAITEEADGFPDVVDLHGLIATLSANRRLAAQVEQINTELRLARSRSGSTPARAALALAEHEEIINHLAARDPAKAALAMRSHLSGSLANTLALVYSP